MIIGLWLTIIFQPMIRDGQVWAEGETTSACFLQCGSDLNCLFNCCSLECADDPDCLSECLGGPSSEEKASIFGQVVDSQTGLSLTGVSVDLEIEALSGGFSMYSETTTDDSGGYLFSNLPSGTYKISTSWSGYVPDSSTLTLAVNEAGRANFALSRISAEGEYRLILTWAETPADLDSHLFIPTTIDSSTASGCSLLYGDDAVSLAGCCSSACGTDPNCFFSCMAGLSTEESTLCYHLSYDQKGYTIGFPYAWLDLDEALGYGPETISIIQPQSGLYEYWVHNYSQSPDLTTSQAVVKLYSGVSLLRTFTVPSGPEGNAAWHVFDLEAVSGQIIEVNTLEPDFGSAGCSPALVIPPLPEVNIDPVISPTMENSQTVTGIRSEDATITIEVTSTALPGLVSYPSSTSWSCTITELVEGDNTIMVTARNEASQTATTEAVINFSPATIILSASSCAFNPQELGSLSQPKIITLINSSISAVVIEEVSITGTGSLDFSLNSDTCHFTALGPGQECSFTLLFVPSVAGYRQAELVITTNYNLTSPLKVALSGLGYQPGSVVINTPSEAFPTIQEAVQKSQPGDTIVIAAGHYTENVTIGHELRLVGAGLNETIIEGNLNLAAAVDLEYLSLYGGQVRLENVHSATIRWEFCLFIGQEGQDGFLDLSGSGHGKPGQEAAFIQGNNLVLILTESTFIGGDGGFGRDGLADLLSNGQGGDGGYGLVIEGIYPTLLGGTFSGGDGGAPGCCDTGEIICAEAGQDAGPIHANSALVNLCEVEGDRLPLVDALSVDCAAYLNQGGVSVLGCQGDLTLLKLKPVSPDPRRVITSVTADLTAFGLSAQEPLNDDGTDGDEVAVDGFYSLGFMVPEGLEQNLYVVTTTVTDDASKSGKPSVNLEVSACAPLGWVTLTPSMIKAGQTVLITAEAIDPDGNLVFLTADLTNLGGGEAVELLDNGQDGDFEAGDGHYSVLFTLPSGLNPGPKLIQVTMTDHEGNISRFDQNLLVMSSREIVLASFESGDLSAGQWVGEPSMLQTDEVLQGQYAAFFHNWNSLPFYSPSAELTVNVLDDGYISFWCKMISSEGFFDFSIDGFPLYSFEASWEGGQTPWQQIRLPLSTGTHLLEWAVNNGWGTESGNGARAWLDAVSFEPQPTWSVSPKVHDYGTIGLGNTSSQSFTLTNCSREDLGLASLTISGQDATEFALQNDHCSSQMVASQSACTFEVVFTPKTEGEKQVLLTITPEAGVEEQVTILLEGIGECTEELSPQALFTVESTKGCAPYQVVFTNTSTGAASFEWDFGNGETSTSTNPSYIYTAAGTYTLTLEATSLCGSSTKEITIEVGEFEIEAQASPYVGYAPLEVEFLLTTSCAKEPSTIEWSFGDEETSTEPNPTHTYSQAGFYEVLVQVFDAQGRSKTKSMMIEVKPFSYTRTDTTSFFWGQIMITSQGIAVGDWVGAFTEDGLCVGGFEITQAGRYGSLAVYGDDLTTEAKDGAIDNEQISFRAWQAQSGQMIDLSPIGPDEPRWLAGEINQVNLTTTFQQRIPLAVGWNLISFQINSCFYESEPQVFIPQGTAMVNVGYLQEWLSDDQSSPLRDALDPNQAGDWQRITSFDVAGAHLLDRNIPSNFNSLKYLSVGYGYWIKMNQPGVLILNGQYIPEDTSLVLQSGWNLVGYIPHTICLGELDQEYICPFTNGYYQEDEQIEYQQLTSSLSEALVSIEATYRRLTTFDPCQGATIFDTMIPPFANTLHYLGPKYGYWIKIEDPDGGHLNWSH